VLDGQGIPRLWGIGWVRRIPAEAARLYEVSAPGIGLRIYPEAAGVSIGYRRTLLFFPAGGEDGKPTPLAAMQQVICGLDVSPYSVTVGYGRELTVGKPLEPDLVQEIHYSDRDEAHTVVNREEHP